LVLHFTDVPRTRTAPDFVVQAETVLGLVTATAVPPIPTDRAATPASRDTNGMFMVGASVVDVVLL